MPTYNRVVEVDGKRRADILDRAVECFLRQTFTDTELVIVNDTPGQRLKISHPRIRVFNFNNRFDTLGEKCQYAAMYCAQGRYVTRWDDDDINFPDRLQKSIKISTEHDSDGVLFQGCYYWSGAGEVFFVPGTGMQCDFYKRELFEERKLEYPARSTGEDLHVREQLRLSSAKSQVVDLTADTAIYLYDRSPSPYIHVSQWGPGEAAYEQIGETRIVEGVYEIEPQWDRDWVQWIKSNEIPRPPLKAKT
jgi:glycosyltransferase involved in cell wall biosynthesis